MCAHHDLRLLFSTREVLVKHIFSLACLFDSLVRVSRRVKEPHSRAPTLRTLRRAQAGCSLQAVQSTYRGLHVPPSLCTWLPAGFGYDQRDNASKGGVGMKWRYFHYHCHDFRFYVTLFPKCFSNFRSRYLFAIGLPTLYLTLADTYLPLDTAFPSSATLLALLREMLGFLAQWASTFFGSILARRVVFSNGFVNFTNPAPFTKQRVPQLKAL